MPLPPNVAHGAAALRGAIVKRLQVRRLTSIVAPADYLTLGNAFAGFLAIVVISGVADLYEKPFFGSFWPGGASADDRFLLAGILMGLGLVCDALDGVVARKFGGSRLGGDLDTLADATTFVITPAFLVLAKYGDESPFRAFLVAGLIVIMGLLRLARFNANPIETETKTFQGLPTPWMAITVALMVVTDIPLQWGLPFATVLAFLMMSNVAYPKSKGRTRYVTYLMILSALAVIGLLFWFPNDSPRVIRTAFVIVALTVAVAPLLIATRVMRERRLPAAGSPEAPPPPTSEGARPRG